MNVAINLKTKYRQRILLCMALGMVLLGGCKGETAAPFGSTITVEAFGVPIVSNLTVTANASKTQNYHVTVLDETGAPLNGIEVNFIGQFTSGEPVVFSGASGTAPVSLSASQKTDQFGFVNFQISAPYYTIKPIHAPYNQSATGSLTGGSLVGGTYLYTVTALDFAGETEATSAVQAIVSGATTTTGSVTVSWSAVPGATSYRIYGRSGTIGALVTILNPSGDPLTFVDTGTYSQTGITPPTVNTTGLSLNSIIGSMIASTGTAHATLNISF